MAAGNPLALTAEIEHFRRQFEQLAHDADALAGGLSNQQFNWHPAAGAWSVAQCIDHLNVTARLYLPMLDEGIADAIRRGLYASGPFHYNWFNRFVARSMEPPARLRTRAPKAFQPPADRPRPDVMAAFRAYQVQFVDRLRQANGLDQTRTRVRSPIATWWRMPLGTALALITAHERRHLWQARRVTEAPGFPPR
jgi:hypothetical protein